MKLAVCGSIAFYSEMEALRDRLESEGHEVLIPELADEAPPEFGGDKKVYFGQYVEENGGIDAFAPDHQIWELKRAAIEDHFRKIEWADAVLVANYDKRGMRGYVGGNTLIEIGVAFYLQKPIYLLNDVSSDLSYKVEILGMKPTVLHGDTRKIA